jgi:putative phosphonate metabolism protein
MTALEGYARYAIFWVPPPGSGLARFGAEWLGWDTDAGRPVPQPALDLPRPLDQITRAPRRYGFHGTLKPPFRLNSGASAAGLDRALTNLAAGQPPAGAPGLSVSTRLGFLALMPTGTALAVDALAAACTRDLDRFRAAPGAAELAQRRVHGLTAGQEENLTRWGYPYVFEDFRFHLTLSGRLLPGEAEALTDAATALAAPHLDPVLRLDDICLFGDPGAGREFHLLRRYPLKG